MSLVIVPLPGNEDIAASIARALLCDLVVPEMRQFPDCETYFRLSSNVRGQTVVLVCTLDRADSKFLPLIFAADTVRDLGAARVGLVAPYLGYMRQDRRFLAGEAVSSRIFAASLSPHIDWLVTVDPHLHRVHSLNELFALPACALHAAKAVAAWIAREVKKPVLIGPDSESTQWVGQVAKEANAAFVVLDKTRKSDRQVEISLPDVDRWRGHTPVLIDDIISTGRTMIETLEQLRHAGMEPPVCVGVHAVFAAAAYESLLAERPARIVTTNTIKHQSNCIDVSPLLADAIREVSS